VAGKLKEAVQTAKGKNTEAPDISGRYPGHTPALQTLENNFFLLFTVSVCRLFACTFFRQKAGHKKNSPGEFCDPHWIQTSDLSRKLSGLLYSAERISHSIYFLLFLDLISLSRRIARISERWVSVYFTIHGVPLLVKLTFPEL
jgi:hypothetical protein